MPMEVFRFGHRPGRDKRITTHVALVARAFGCSAMYLYRPDPKIKAVVDEINKKWGGSFEVINVQNWRRELHELKKEKFIVHLTMYGLNINSFDLSEIPEDAIVFVGAEKVPPEVYRIADINLAIGNQPHSEVAALAVFLDRYFKGKELELEFPGAKLRIKGDLHGRKRVERL